MATLVRDFFARHGLGEGRDVLLGNSPNRVMPGRLVERVSTSDKLVAGLHPDTPGLIQRLYARIVTRGTLHPTNSMTAEVVKTLENAYRDVRIAYAAEVARHCDQRDVDFYALRDQVNARLAQADQASADRNAVPSGGLLVPTVGVGGHCLPKDGILLWWRALEPRRDTARSLILDARRINDDSPAQTLALAERAFGPLNGRAVALLGAAYRFNSEDTRNSPTLVLARLLLDRGARVTIHDTYVYPTDQNLRRTGLADFFTRDLEAAVAPADVLVMCTAHRVYLDEREACSAPVRLHWYDTLLPAHNLVPGDHQQWGVELHPSGQHRRLYNLHLRTTDSFGNVSHEGIIWSGVLNTKNPVVTASGQHLGGGSAAQTQYTFSFSDFILDESRYTQPCGVNELVSLTYNDALLPYDGIVYNVTATCRVAGTKRVVISRTVIRWDIAPQSM